MAQLAFFFFLIFPLFIQAKSLSIEFYGESTLPKKTIVGGELVGGLSGIFWNGKRLYSVSDDRGKYGKPRFFEFDLIIKNSTVKLEPLKAIKLEGIDSMWRLDLEGISLLPNGDFVFTSEGDNNVKPRALPKVFITNANGAYKSELLVPSKFLPDLLGQQKKGIQNNRGFEGLTSSSDGQNIYIMNESPIMGDQNSKKDAQWLRMVHYIKDGDSFKFYEEYAYLLDRQDKTGKGTEVFRGLTDVLYVGDSKFITLERGTRLGSQGFTYAAAIYLVDFSKSKDVSTIDNLSLSNAVSARKERLIDFEKALIKFKIENYEGLSWGPVLLDGRRTLLVLSDNNFSNRENTQLLVFAVKEVE